MELPTALHLLALASVVYAPSVQQINLVASSTCSALLPYATYDPRGQFMLKRERFLRQIKREI